MNLANTIAARSLVQIKSAVENKVTKVGAGYVHRPNTEYRCKDCLLFIPGSQQCALFRPQDVVKASGTCIYWANGTPMMGIKPQGAYTPKEAGYTEASNGTLCRRCRFFDGPYCKKVDEKSPGDDPGKIHPEACCANQEPK